MGLCPRKWMGGSHKRRLSITFQASLANINPFTRTCCVGRARLWENGSSSILRLQRSRALFCHRCVGNKHALWCVIICFKITCLVLQIRWKQPLPSACHYEDRMHLWLQTQEMDPQTGTVPSHILCEHTDCFQVGASSKFSDERFSNAATDASLPGGM